MGCRVPGFGISQGSVEDTRLSNTHFLYVQLRCDNMFCPLDEKFVFLTLSAIYFSNGQAVVFLDSLVSVPRGPPGVVLLGMWCWCCRTVFLPLWLIKAWWAGIVLSLCPVQCCCIGSLRGICQVGGPQSDTTSSLLHIIPISHLPYE